MDICITSCEYALDVGMAEYSGKKPGKSCGNCAHYNPIEPPVFVYDRLAALVDIRPFDNDLNPCAERCAYGACTPNMSDPCGCGGCCGCLGGCEVEHDNQQIAPFLWEGDYA